MACGCAVSAAKTDTDLRDKSIRLLLGTKSGYFFAAVWVSRKQRDSKGYRDDVEKADKCGIEVMAEL